MSTKLATCRIYGIRDSIWLLADLETAGFPCAATIAVHFRLSKCPAFKKGARLEIASAAIEARSAVPGRRRLKPEPVFTTSGTWCMPARVGIPVLRSCSTRQGQRRAFPSFEASSQGSHLSTGVHGLRNPTDGRQRSGTCRTRCDIAAHRMRGASFRVNIFVC